MWYRSSSGSWSVGTRWYGKMKYVFVLLLCCVFPFNVDDFDFFLCVCALVMMGRKPTTGVGDHGFHWVQKPRGV